MEKIREIDKLWFYFTDPFQDFVSEIIEDEGTTTINTGLDENSSLSETEITSDTITTATSITSPTTTTSTTSSTQIYSNLLKFTQNSNSLKFTQIYSNFP